MMGTVYTFCAIIGGTLFILQFVASLFGFGGDSGHDAQFDSSHDVGHAGVDHGHGHGGAWLLSIFSIRGIIAAITFFGLTGMAMSTSGSDPNMTLLTASGAALAALLFVAAFMSFLMRLRDDGTIQIEHSVGKTGTVYLPIPGKKAGVGKVTLDLQNRTTEIQAVTFSDSLPTGAKVVVVDVIGPDMVEVVASPLYSGVNNA